MQGSILSAMVYSAGQSSWKTVLGWVFILGLFTYIPVKVLVDRHQAQRVTQTMRVQVSEVRPRIRHYAFNKNHIVIAKTPPGSACRQVTFSYQVYKNEPGARLRVGSFVEVKVLPKDASCAKSTTNTQEAVLAQPTKAQTDQGWLLIAISVLMWSLLPFAIINSRRSKKDQPTPRKVKIYAIIVAAAWILLALVAIVKLAQRAALV